MVGVGEEGKEAFAGDETDAAVAFRLGKEGGFVFLISCSGNGCGSIVTP